MLTLSAVYSDTLRWREARTAVQGQTFMYFAIKTHVPSNTLTWDTLHEKTNSMLHNFLSKALRAMNPGTIEVPLRMHIHPKNQFS